jgi:hypothetical protein
MSGNSSGSCSNGLAVCSRYAAQPCAPAAATGAGLSIAAPATSASSRHSSHLAPSPVSRQAASALSREAPPPPPPAAAEEAEPAASPCRDWACAATAADTSFRLSTTSPMLQGRGRQTRVADG